MYPVLLSLYGPLAIHSYGFFIALGVAMFVLGVKHDKKCVQIGIDKQIITILYFGFFGAFFGGRLMYCATEMTNMNLYQVLLPWNGGFSILGSVLGVFGTLMFYFIKTQDSFFASCDAMIPYVPLLQSIGRIGCFFAGCCYGKDCPIQLYSSFLLFLIFLILFLKKDMYVLWSGVLTLQYLMLTSLERFFLDFYRGDQAFLFFNAFLSDNQIVALLIFFSCCIGYMYNLGSNNTPNRQIFRKMH